MAAASAALTLAGCPERVPPYDPGPAPPRSTIIKFVAHEVGVEAFLEPYWRYKPNKAFAASDDGVYGYSAEGMSSAEFAEKSALAYCEFHRGKGSYPSPCRVVNVNGRWVDREAGAPR